jgi:hypothetical protein
MYRPEQVSCHRLGHVGRRLLAQRASVLWRDFVVAVQSDLGHRAQVHADALVCLGDGGRGVLYFSCLSLTQARNS